MDILLDDEILTKLETIANDENLSVSDLVEKIIEDFFMGECEGL